MDGGLERLVRMLHAFILTPPLPESSSIIFGLAQTTTTRAQTTSSNKDIIPAHFDKPAAHRFSLAFQCLVNIGVRGSEPIRSRVVQAGTLDVVGCILEAWLVQRGFANPVISLAPPPGAPSATPSRPRGPATETREQRHARRAARTHFEQMQALHRGATAEEIQRFWAFANASPPPFASGNPGRRAIQAAAPAIPPPPPSGIAMTAAQRDRVQAAIRHQQQAHLQRQQLQQQAQEQATRIARSSTLRPRSSTIRPSAAPPSSATVQSPTSASADDSDSSIHIPDPREDETTSDDDVPRQQRQTPRRRTSTLIASQGTATPTNRGGGTPDAHIIISNGADEPSLVVGDAIDVAAAGGVGVNGDGVSIGQANDDMAMGAPPGAPGALPVTRPPNSRMSSTNTNEESSGTESEREREPDQEMTTTTPGASTRPLPHADQRAWSDTELPTQSSSSQPPHPMHHQSDTELPMASSSSSNRYHDEDMRMEVEETPRAGVVALPSSTHPSSSPHQYPFIPESTATIRQHHPPPRAQAGPSRAPDLSSTPPTTAFNIFRAPSISPVQRPTNPMIRPQHPTVPGTATHVNPPPTAPVAARQAIPSPPPPGVPQRIVYSRTAATASTSGTASGEGPYRDDDVLLSLQLLAYLSKYPHVRQVSIR